jgi:urea transport system permease protein
MTPPPFHCMKSCRLLKSVALVLLGVLFAGHARAAPSIAPEEIALRQKFIRTLLSTGAQQQELLGELADSGSKLVRDLLTSWTRGEIYIYVAPDNPAKIPLLLEEQQDADGKARGIRIDNGLFLTDASGKELRFTSDDLTTADTDMRLRSAIQQAFDMLSLADPDVDARQNAVIKLGYSQKLQYLPILQARLTKETNPDVKRALDEGVALLQLSTSDSGVRVAATQQLAHLGSIGSLDTLKQLAANKNTDPAVAQAATNAVQAIERHITWVNFFGTIFHSLSLGSILLVVALGLAITFGLMGIINMAHGEMIAVGAYTTYLVQNIFGDGITLSPFGFSFTLPGLHASGWFYQSYFIFAIPLSFLTAALAGLALERSVIRFLYRRPLESLLATWGVSLILQQLFRRIFGANNVQVNSPTWLLGHFAVNDILFGYNRIFVIIFAVVIVFGTWLLLTKTPLGLFIRAVMQNRDMAACMGVRTNRVNMLTFAFGSGLAGLAGAFLSQIGNVGPSLGQSYIVDSFMTVVVGGVGNLAGTVYSALGIGTADETLQQLLGSPVMGKIIVLCAIILFLQWKPGGLFAARSRNLDN